MLLGAALLSNVLNLPGTSAGRLLPEGILHEVRGGSGGNPSNSPFDCGAYNLPNTPPPNGSWQGGWYCGANKGTSDGTYCVVCTNNSDVTQQVNYNKIVTPGYYQPQNNSTLDCSGTRKTGTCKNGVCQGLTLEGNCTGTIKNYILQTTPPPP
ncbi:MAG: hypothetical protein KGM43_19090 [Planctomycetota bacterium]|nr:hypothetical protein [Planctomycetota bacterium]